VSRKVTYILFALLIHFAAASSAKAGYRIPDDLSIGSNIAYVTVVEATLGSSSSVLATEPVSENLKRGAVFLCENFDDPRCQDKHTMSGTIVLSPCSITSTTACIESLSVGSSETSLVGTKLRFEGLGHKVPESKIAGVPAGGSPSVWSTDGLDNFVVLAEIVYIRGKADSVAHIHQFTVNAFPVTLIEDSKYQAPRFSQILDGDRTTVSLLNTGTQDDECFLVTDGLCYLRDEFKENTRVKLELRVPHNVTGWLFGRMRSPSIQVRPINDKSNLLTVEATSVQVPNLIGTLTKSEVRSNPGILAWTRTLPMASTDSLLDNLLKSPGSVGQINRGNDQLQLISWWGQLLKSYGGTDKKFAVSSRWMFGSSPSGQNSNPCFADKSRLIGLVTTNAPIYESGPPKMVDGALNYLVGGPHHLGDGKSLFRGVYDLAIRSETARCIYKFSDAPIRAEISVTSADGTVQEYATESITERDGWIRLGAYNFTFSTPTVKVRLLQDTSTQQSQGNTSAPSKSSADLNPTAKGSKLVKCVNSKTGKTKLVTRSMKCPRGFVNNR